MTEVLSVTNANARLRMGVCTFPFADTLCKNTQRDISQRRRAVCAATVAAEWRMSDFESGGEVGDSGGRRGGHRGGHRGGDAAPARVETGSGRAGRRGGPTVGRRRRAAAGAASVGRRGGPPGGGRRRRTLWWRRTFVPDLPTCNPHASAAPTRSVRGVPSPSHPLRTTTVLLTALACLSAASRLAVRLHPRHVRHLPVRFMQSARRRTPRALDLSLIHI